MSALSPCPYCAGRREAGALILRCDSVAREPMLFHEAGHAAAVIALGGTVHSLRANSEAAHAVVSLEAPRAALAAVVAAGPAAGNWQKRWIVGPDTIDLISALERVPAGLSGDCDQCRLARFTYVGPTDDEIAQAIALHRFIEQLALDLIRFPPIWRAIRTIAAALAPTGELAGETVHEIAALHFTPGEFAFQT